MIIYGCGFSRYIKKDMFNFNFFIDDKNNKQNVLYLHSSQRRSKNSKSTNLYLINLATHVTEHIIRYEMKRASNIRQKTLTHNLKKKRCVN